MNFGSHSKKAAQITLSISERIATARRNPFPLWTIAYGATMIYVLNQLERWTSKL